MVRSSKPVPPGHAPPAQGVHSGQGGGTGQGVQLQATSTMPASINMRPNIPLPGFVLERLTPTEDDILFILSTIYRDHLVVLLINTKAKPDNYGFA